MKDKLTFELDKKEVENQIVVALRNQIKSYATSIGLATFDLSKYVKENKELQKLIVEEIKKKLHDNKFMRELIIGIIQSEDLRTKK